MLLSSPRTRFIKTTIPATVFLVATISVLFTLRKTALAEPLESIFVLIAFYGCAAWALWRPWRLKVADHVEDRSNMLNIRRGDVEVQMPYSEVQRVEYLRIGTSAGVKLTFKRQNKFGSEIGFYLNENVDPSKASRDDSISHMERQIELCRHGRAV